VQPTADYSSADASAANRVLGHPGGRDDAGATRRCQSERAVGQCTLVW